MKKFFLFASAALVLASCSSEAEEAVIKPNETPEEEVLELTEIKLGAGAPTAAAETRAIVDIAGTFDDTKVGIFGVNENGGATNNDWSDYEAPNNMNIAKEKAVILFNEPATINGNTVTFDRINDNEEPTNKFYFPRTNINNYGYTFIGYYPKVDDGNVTPSAENIVVEGTFDGTQDIIAGKAPTATSVEGSPVGYNAKYIRNFRSDNTANPSHEDYPEIDIKFTHLTSKIIVKLQKKANYIQKMCDVYAAWFDVNNKYNITFVKGNNSAEYALTFVGDGVNKAYAIGGGEFSDSKAYEAGDVVKYQGTYYEFTQPHSAGEWSIGQVRTFTPIPPVDDPSGELGFPIFIEPDPKDNGLTATKKLYLVLNDDIDDVKEVTVTSPGDGFKAGKAYTVTVTINGPEAITVTASITDWANGGNVPDVEI